MSAEKIEIKRNKKNLNIFDVKMTITEGKLLAMIYATAERGTAVSADVCHMLSEAAKKEGIDF